MADEIVKDSAKGDFQYDICPELGLPCACIGCVPIGHCLEDPCVGFSGPTDDRCESPD